MIKQFRIAFGLKMGSSILTFRARHVPNAPEGYLEARWRDWPLTFFCQTFPKLIQKCQFFFENWSGRGPYGFLWIRMDPYGSVWSLRTPWGLPGVSWGPGGPKKGGKGGSPPGGARGALLGGLPISPSWANRLSSLIRPHGRVTWYGLMACLWYALKGCLWYGRLSGPLI